MVTSVTPSVACKTSPPTSKQLYQQTSSSSFNQTCSSSEKAALESADSDEDFTAALKESALQTTNNVLVSVALRPTAILYHLLRSSSNQQQQFQLQLTSPTFPSPPPKKGFVEKMFGRRKSVTLNESDPMFKTVYLGNVVTSLPKGEGCLKKPLEAIWKHYKSTKQAPAEMQLTVTNAGLKARTVEQGIIQYKANRLTHCAAPLEYPKLFAWIYKHDAKNMKFESRCHAVLCHDEFKARELSAALEARLQFVFAEWLRQKRSRSQILDRLRNPELAAALPAMPARKQMLSAGQKYKPQESKARSLSSIREASDEDPSSEDDEDRKLSLLAADRLGFGSRRRSKSPQISGSSDCDGEATPPAMFDDIAEEEEEDAEEQELEQQFEDEIDDEDQEDFVNDYPTVSNPNNNEIALTRIPSSRGHSNNNNNKIDNNKSQSR